MKVFVTTY